MRSPAFFPSLFTFLLAVPCGADDTAKLSALFASVSESGGVVTIPPGDCRLDGAATIPLASDATVFAHGARFHFPETLGEGGRIDIRDNPGAELKRSQIDFNHGRR